MLDLLQSQFVFLSCTAILSLMVGSFLNVLIGRLPKMLHQTYREQCYLYLNETQSQNFIIEKTATFNLIYPNSHCDHCHTPIQIKDNIPLLSFLLLKGRCRTCHQRIAWRYPAIEFFTMIVSLLTAYFLGPTLKTVFALVFTWVLIALSMIDFDHQILPDDLIFPFLWLGLGLNIFALYVPLSEAVLGAMLGYLFLWGIYWIFKILTGKEGMGYGDFKLLAMLGAWCGWQSLPALILIAASLGALVGIGAILLKKITRSQPIPFGPFLAFAGWVVLVFHEKVPVWFGLLG